MTVAVIQFPGSNCEYETLSALHEVGLEADVVAWNSAISVLDSYKGFILPGGFSFQDRVRAGVVSSKLPILNVIKDKASQGVPILGICNGCQILAESGILPDYDHGASMEMGLAPNMNQESYHGFVCDWVYVKIKYPQASLFTRYFDDSDVLPIQINHGEGNFKFYNKEVVQSSQATQFVYCDEEGDASLSYPVNPNGSDLNMAGLCNQAGNVLAMMPHPERGMFWYHIPRYLHHHLSQKRRDDNLLAGPWQKLFESLRDYIKETY
ncbi:MAG: phosphoribosylformylglycinamidine synthase I [Actinobacteria bacterium]|nr:phosphoribosylformylglycinamidine synthase I [Actinomycetota bacterium]|tara:strand:+ start:2496 stop:3293 length:798 start_codon:yes stop_codon:yes gene_type:complete